MFKFSRSDYNGATDIRLTLPPYTTIKLSKYRKQLFLGTEQQAVLMCDFQENRNTWSGSHIQPNFQSGHTFQTVVRGSRAKAEPNRAQRFCRAERQGSEFQTIVAAIICEASGRQERLHLKGSSKTMQKDSLIGNRVFAWMLNCMYTGKHPQGLQENSYQWVVRTKIPGVAACWESN